LRDSHRVQPVIKLAAAVPMIVTKVECVARYRPPVAVAIVLKAS
jgi:hypothetical protein